jgi:hypothetical protein
VGFDPPDALYILRSCSVFTCAALQLIHLAGRALDYQETINSYVSCNKEIHPFELSNADWESIKIVTLWLKSFRVATTEMSAMKTPMLSIMHAIFQGLQDDIKNILRSLPDTV